MDQDRDHRLEDQLGDHQELDQTQQWNDQAVQSKHQECLQVDWLAELQPPLGRRCRGVQLYALLERRR
ncbi:MAG: Uncharacterised protein [Marinobacterium sp. xm-d-530]|nr:MAG: Uncharacterised protein [Marinobacterium sp. xm-d-530]